MVLQGWGCCRHNCQICICVRTPYLVSALMEEIFTQKWDSCTCLLCIHVLACDRPSSYSKTSYCCAGMT